MMATNAGYEGYLTGQQYEQQLASLRAEVAEWKAAVDASDRQAADALVAFGKADAEVEGLKEEVDTLTQQEDAWSAEVEGLRALLEEYTDWDGTMVKKLGRKPTHGTCCTCQECGECYDDCVCEHNEIVARIDAATGGA